jgi:hypothetical protein
MNGHQNLCKSLIFKGKIHHKVLKVLKFFLNNNSAVGNFKEKIWTRTAAYGYHLAMLWRPQDGA